MRKSGQAVIVEGYTDALMAHQAGFDNVVASLGTALTPGQVALLTRYAKRIALAYDVDAAGQKAGTFGVQALEGLIGQLAATESGVELDEVRVVRLPDGKDPDEVVRTSPDLWREEVRTAQPIVDYLIDTYAKTYDLKTPGGKARFVDALMPTIRAVPNPVMRDGWLQRVRQVSGVEERVLLEVLRGGRSATGLARPAGASAAATMRPVRISAETRDRGPGRPARRRHPARRPAPGAGAPPAHAPGPRGPGPDHRRRRAGPAPEHGRARAVPGARARPRAGRPGHPPAVQPDRARPGAGSGDRGPRPGARRPPRTEPARPHPAGALATRSSASSSTSRSARSTNARSSPRTRSRRRSRPAIARPPSASSANPRPSTTSGDRSIDAATRPDSSSSPQGGSTRHAHGPARSAARRSRPHPPAPRPGRARGGQARRHPHQGRRGRRRRRPRRTTTSAR